MTRVGLIGLGQAGLGIHLPACGMIADIEVVGGCDPVPRGTEGLKFPVFASISELVRAQAPELLIIATPPDLHSVGVEEALESGTHVLCEKPFTGTLAEARRLLAVAVRHDRRIFVNNQYRYMPTHRAAQSAIGREPFGELQFVSAEQTFHRRVQNEQGWRGEGPQRTCKEFGTHVFDLMRFFFDEEPRRLEARMPLRAGSESPDFLVLAHLEFSRGRVAQVTLDRLTKGRHSYLDIRLDGTGAAVETHLGGRAEFRVGLRGGDRRPFFDFELAGGGTAKLFQGERVRRLASSPLNVFVDATASLLGEVLASLSDGSVCESDATRNIYSLALMEAAYRSAEIGAPVEMGDLL